MGVGGQRPFNVLKGRQHGLLVVRQRLLLARVLEVDVGANAPGVENPPLRHRPRRPITASRVEPIAGIDAFQARVPCQRELREKIRLGHADARRRGGQLAFGLLNVGSPVNQIRRQAHRHRRRRGGDCRVAGQFVHQCAGRQAEQYGERYAQDRNPVSNAGSLRLRRGQQRLALPHVQFGGQGPRAKRSRVKSRIFCCAVDVVPQHASAAAETRGPGRNCGPLRRTP